MDQIAIFKKRDVFEINQGKCRCLNPWEVHMKKGNVRT